MTKIKCYLNHIDEDINTIDTSTPTQVPINGPITCARACQLNDQVSSFLSLCPHYLDHGDECNLVFLGTIERIKRGEDSRGLDSVCRTTPTCDGHPASYGPFWMIKYFMESLSILLSNGSRLISIFVLSQPQLTIYYRVLFCP